ncbi:MAG: alpha/beta fold hydrolase [Anaerolineae bacterium]
MTNWTDGFVETNGMTMHYMHTGSPTSTGGPKPQVVLCHGFSDDGACWTSLAKSLEDDYDVTMIDARCHGQSSAPESDNNADAMAADLAGFIEAMSLDQPAVAGHSMGARYTQLFAAKYPHLLRGLILEDPPWCDPGEERARRSDPGRMERLQAFKEQSLEEGVAACEAEYPNWEPGTCELYFRAKQALNFNHFTGAVPDATTWQESLPDVKCPVLMFTGDPELGAIVTEEIFAIAKSLAPQIERVHVPGVGHHIRYAAPQPFAEATRAFLHRVF